MVYLKILFFSCMLCIGMQAISQEAYLKSWMTHHTATKGQVIKLHFEANHELSQFTPPKEQHFKYIGSSRSVQVSVLEGVRTYKEVISYTVSFSDTGYFTIGVASGLVNDEMLQTDEINVKILPKTSRNGVENSVGRDSTSANDVNLFFRTNKTTCGFTDSIQLELVIHSRFHLRGIDEVDLPEFDDFWVKRIEIEPRISKSMNSANTQEHESVVICKWLLYPLKSGTLKINKVSVSLQANTLGKTHGFFDRAVDTIVKMTSNEVLISVSEEGTSGDSRVSYYQSVLKNPKKNPSDKNRPEKSALAFVIDVSGSMRAQDFKPDRLKAAQLVVKDYVNSTKNDFCLVRFAGESESLCSIEEGKAAMNRTLDSLGRHAIPDGTAIGSAILTAIETLSGADGEKKNIVLITDGDSNRGMVSTQTASEIAAKLNINIYIVCLVNSEPISIPIKTVFGQGTTQQFTLNVDSEILERAAFISSGKLYMVHDEQALKKALKDIKSEIELK